MKRLPSYIRNKKEYRVTISTSNKVYYRVYRAKNTRSIGYNLDQEFGSDYVILFIGEVK